MRELFRIPNDERARTLGEQVFAIILAIVILAVVLWFA
jgi:hypothetical protein